MSSTITAMMSTMTAMMSIMTAMISRTVHISTFDSRIHKSTGGVQTQRASQMDKSKSRRSTSGKTALRKAKSGSRISKSK